jgi:hypothetical protein
MHRLRRLLQGPFAAWVVVWAGLIAGVNVAPSATLSLPWPGGWDTHAGDDIQAQASFPRQPPIAEVLGLRSEVHPATETASPSGLSPVARSRRGLPAAFGFFPSPPGVDGVTGAGRYRLLCTYRL